MKIKAHPPGYVVLEHCHRDGSPGNTSSLYLSDAITLLGASHPAVKEARLMRIGVLEGQLAHCETRLEELRGEIKTLKEMS